ncbi:MAG: DUF5801 repeats-in-toxin domain-containing protein [Erythrobacter sp.]
MVDFEGGKRGGFDADNGSNETFDAGSNEFQESPVSYSAGTRFLVPDANGVVILPEGASLEDMTLQGGDLVITLADGSTFVFPDAVYTLPDGSIFVPQIVSEGVALDPTDVSEFLNPEGPGLPQLPTRSSGGNFEEDPGNIQDAFGLGDLLPFTELSRILEEDEEILPNPDEEPEIVIETPDNPVGAVNAIATVAEEGLPERNEGEPEGTDEPGTAEQTSGTIVFEAADGLDAIFLNGEEITAVGQEFVTDLGTLTITGIDLASGEIGFDYLLQDNTLTEGAVDNFEVTVVDVTGDQADATLAVNIIDDAPIAFNDTANIAGGEFGPVTGNVVDNDISGADGFPEDGAVTGFSNADGAGEPGDTLQGEYGTLKLNADGSFSYARDFNTPGGVEESFDYDIVDQDGSTSSATLLIVIGDAPAEITFVPVIGEGTEVNEAGLPPRGDDPVGSGEGADGDDNNDSDPSENTGATITFESPDGVDTITIDGTPIDVENLPQTIIVDGGTLVITDVTYDPETGDGTITYDFTLDDNTDGDDTTVEFDIEVTDLDGDTAEDTVVINVIDDVPEAVDDSATQTAENAPITVDAFANDIEGADGVELTAIAAVDGTLSGAGDLVYNDDGTFTYTPAPGEEGTVTFDYTITDGDGDVSTATVTIDLLEDSTPEISVEGGDTVDEAGLAARGDEPAGSDEAADTENTSGSIPINTGNDTVASLVINGVDVTAGGTVTTDKGVLTITLTDGDYTYSYELTDNTLSDPDTDAFELVVTDSDGDTASTDLVINILDDVPEAVDDSATQTAEDAPITVDAFANDTEGADGVELTAIAVVDGTLSGAGEVVYNDDGTFTYTPVAGEEGTVTFDYTITDGDGDVSTATVTIDLLPDSTPEISAEGNDIVDEAGLPARAGEPAGSDEAADSETTTGVIAINTGNDTIDSLIINGVDVTAGGTVTTDKGVLTVTEDNGAYSYSYELTDNTLSDPDSDSFTLTVTDSDGDTAGTTIVIAIQDDTPSAEDDANSIAAGEYGPVTGDVLANDTQGADGADVTGFTGSGGAGAPGDTVQGTYGTLMLNADGSYSYTRDPGTPGDVQDTFTYTITDGDGDTAQADLVISIGDSPVTLDVPVAGEAGTIVEEDGLAGPPAGSDAASNSEFTTGTITYTAPDGPASVTIGGVAVTGAGQTITGAFGTLTIDAVSEGSITYTYELTTNTNGDTTSDTFEVVVTDQDGDSSTDDLVIAIVDDVPTAVDDTDSIDEGGSVSTSGNVITDAEANGDNGADTTGADGAVVQNAGTIAGTYGDLVLNADGSYTYTLTQFGFSQLETLSDGESFVEEFDYTLVDGDGDTSDATLTITLNGEDDIVTVNGLDNEVPEVSLDEDDLANVGDDQGSDQSDPLFQTGTFGVTSPDGLDDVQVNGVDVVVDGVFTAVEVANDGVYSVEVTGWTPVFAADGTTVISATFDYTATLLDNTLEHTGLDDAALVEMLTVTADDVDGSSDDAVLDVEIVDDTPDATDNSNTVTEGGSVGGNVVTDDDGDGVDISGADGYATDGAVVSVRTQDGTVLDATPDGAGNYTVVSTLGTLTINQDGTYTYASNANSTNSDTTDTFIYTIRDGDGDESEAELVIDIENVAGNVSDNDVDVDEKGLADGSGELADPAPNTDQSEIDSDGQITVTGATGTLVYTLTGANSDGDGTYGTLVLDSGTGAYTYTLDTEFDHDAGNGRNVENAAESFTYVVKDTLGNEIGTGTINVNITDDIPEIVVDNSGNAPDELITQDEETIGGASDTATSDFTGAFTVSTEVFGADGPGTSGVTYAMTLTAAPGANSGLSSDDADIFLYQLADGTVVGSTAGVAPVAANDPSVVFSIAVDANTGLVTLTQNDEIDHALPGDTSNYDAQLAVLGDDLIGVTATGTITDNDGDTDSESETVDLGGLVQFADDGPTIDAAVTDGDTVKLVTQDAETDGDPTDTDTASTTANFGGAFTIASSGYGADGAGTIAWDFSLSINNAVSGLSSDGDAITLFDIGGKVVGSTAAVIGDVDASNTIFDIAVAADGSVTLSQYEELDHPDNNDTSAPYDDQLLSLADGLVNLDGKATITDGDGDTDSETVSLDLGGNIQFADDGPMVKAGLNSTATVELDETNLASGAATIDLDGKTQGNDTDVTGSPTVIGASTATGVSVLNFTPLYGADGELAGGGVEFELVINSATSGLTTTDGTAIDLVAHSTLDNVVLGVVQGSGDVAFAIEIDAESGELTVEQYVSVNHGVDTDPNDPEQLANGSLSAKVTVTDGDDDEASSADVDITSAITFLDDGPSISVNTAFVAPSLEVDETNLAVDDDGNAFAEAFNSAFGVDGEGNIDYQFDIVDGSDSGLDDVATGESIVLSFDGDDVVGLVSGGIDDGAEAFRLSVDSAGNVSLDQVRALVHGTNPDQNDPVSPTTGSIQLTAVITDGDGDKEEASIDLSDGIVFRDDGPTSATTLTAFLDDDTQGGNAGGPEDQNPDTSNTSGNFVASYGADGGTTALSLSGAPAGFQYISDGADGVLIQQFQDGAFVTVVTVALNADTGAYTVTQNANILHADDGQNDENEQDFTLSGAITDGDGDTVAISLNITVDDDTPVANNGAEITGLVDEDGLIPGGIDDDSDLNDVPGAAVSDNGVVDSLFTAGADAPLTFGLDDSSAAALNALGLTSDGTIVTYTITGTSVVAVAGATPIFTFTLNSDGEWAFNLEGPLDHEIAADGENVNDIEIDFGSLIQATDADGDTINATGSLTVTVDDDTPVANPDADLANEGGTATGNVLTNDLGGADGLESPAIVGITSTNEATSDDTPTASEFVLAGEFGTLTLNENGDYSYDVPADTITVGGDDVFTYTIIDNDGDEVSTTLTFAVSPVNLSGNAPTVTVYEEALDTIVDPGDVAAGSVTGSAPSETTETDTGTVVVAGATEFGIQGGTSAGGFTTLAGTDGTIVINEATGAFTYTLTSPLETTPNANDGVSTETGETFTYTAQDADGNTTTGTIAVNVVDDVPTAAISAAGLALAHDETVGVQGDAQDVAGPLAAFAGVSNAGDDPDVAGTVIGYAQDLSGVVSTGTEFGADGAGTTTFSLDVSASGVDSGLNTTEGTDIVLYKEGDLIVGRVGDQSGEAAFAIAIDASTGGVSMVQYLSVFNPIGGTSSPDEAVSIAAGAVQTVVTVTDGDGDASSASTNIGGAISFQDDAGTLGAFNDLDLVNEANAMDFGTFAYDTGADGHGQFNITGPALDGVLYQPLDHGLVDATDDGVNNPVNGTTLTATTLDGSETLFTLSLDENGNSKFTLVTPDAGSTEVIDLTSLAAAGPVAFNETSDGRIEFSSTTGGVNSSTPGFGVANQFVSAGEQFQVEFHNPGTTGDDATLANAEFFNSAQLANNRDGGNVVYQITIFNDADGTSEVVYTGQILGPVTDIVPITLTEFNRFEVEGISGGGQGARFSTLSLTKSVLPQDLDLDFNVTATDGDGDITSTQVINVEVDASAPAMAAASGGGATTASAFTTTALLDDGSDIGGPTGSGGLLGGGTNSFSNDNDLMMQTAMRGMGSTQIAAAGFGAMMVNFSEMMDGVGNISVTDGTGFQGFAETSYEMASFDPIDGGFNSVVELPQSTGDLALFTSTSVTQFDSVEFTGMNPMADASVRGFEFGGSSDFVSDVYSGPMSGTVGSPDVGADMESLLSLSDDAALPVDIAEASGLRGNQDVAEISVAIEEIVDDIMAEGHMDAMIEHFAGEAAGFTGEMSYLADNALTQSIDGGAFTFGASTVADMTEDAAAMAAVHA